MRPIYRKVIPIYILCLEKIRRKIRIFGEFFGGHIKKSYQQILVLYFT